MVPHDDRHSLSKNGPNDAYLCIKVWYLKQTEEETYIGRADAKVACTRATASVPKTSITTTGSAESAATSLPNEPVPRLSALKSASKKSEQIIEMHTVTSHATENTERFTCRSKKKTIRRKKFEHKYCTTIIVYPRMLILASSTKTTGISKNFSHPIEMCIKMSLTPWLLLS